MQKADIAVIVDNAFDVAIEEIQIQLQQELYPAAFANECSWLRVKGAIELNNRAIREAVKSILVEILDA